MTGRPVRRVEKRWETGDSAQAHPGGTCALVRCLLQGAKRDLEIGGEPRLHRHPGPWPDVRTHPPRGGARPYPKHLEGRAAPVFVVDTGGHVLPGLHPQRAVRLQGVFVSRWSLRLGACRVPSMSGAPGGLEITWKTSVSITTFCKRGD